MRGKDGPVVDGVPRRDVALAAVIRAAETYGPDAAHGRHVTRLALALFDGLRRLHGYGPPERHLLEIAGRLHDIGWSNPGAGKHNKESARMIAALEIPGLDPQDRALCAVIARYHTGAPPDAARHRRFAALDAERRTIVAWLAGMLRVADGLDCDHDGRVKLVACRIDNAAITVRLEGVGHGEDPVAEADRKGDLLRRTAAMTIVFTC